MSIKQKTVLVVDDDQDILLLLNKILSSAGLHVLMAASPEEGRRLLNDNPPHIIISDLHMEPEDGFAFIRSIRMNKQYAHLPIKPLQAQMLIRKIRKALLNKDFVKWQPKEDAAPVLSGEFSAQVTALGETGYSLSGQFKLGSNKDIETYFNDFKSMNLDQHLQRTTAFIQTYQSNGHFLNDILFVGIGETSTRKIRQHILKRATK